MFSTPVLVYAVVNGVKSEEAVKERFRFRVGQLLWSHWSSANDRGRRASATESGRGHGHGRDRASGRATAVVVVVVVVAVVAAAMGKVTVKWGSG